MRGAASNLRKTAHAVIAALAVILLFPARAAAAKPEPERRHVRVAVAGSPPFVVEDRGALTGVSVEVFRELAEMSSLDVELVPMSSVPSALDAIVSREVDLVVGPVSITAERAERTRFTQPYYQSSLAILAPRSEGVFARLSGFTSRAFLAGLAVFLFILLLVGTLVWLVERRANPQQFPRQPAAGIANGVWFALVTMTTVGYGDRVPATPAGRGIAGVWMVISLITASSLTAGIATAITVAQLTPARVTSLEQLADRRVAVVRGTPGVPFVQGARSRIALVSGVDEGFDLVTRRQVEAFVFDRPALRYHLKNNPELDLVVSEARYAPQGYGFAVTDAELQHTLNVALLRMNESGRLERIVSEYLGRDDRGLP